MSRLFNHLFKNFQPWLASKCAATAIEYSLIAAGIAVAIASIIFVLGDTVFVNLYGDLVDIISG